MPLSPFQRQVRKHKGFHLETVSLLLLQNKQTINSDSEQFVGKLPSQSFVKWGAVVSMAVDHKSW